MKVRCWLLVALIVSFSVGALALDRQAFTFSNYNLKVKLDPAKQGLSVSGNLQARNDSATPQKNLVLQISGTLAWKSVMVAEHEVAWIQQPYTSDIDHSGSVSEAILRLPTPVQPGAQVSVKFEYDGTIPLNTGRLLRVNTPGTYAARTDWDRISDSFTAVRGLGYVVWYPVSMEAVSLNDGPAVWDGIAEWNRRQRGSGMKVSFTFPAGQQLVSNADSQKLAEGATELTFQSIGLRVPTFVMAPFEKIERPGVTVYHLAQHTQTARDYVNAAEKVTPQITDWFGPQKSKLVIVELTDPDVLPYDDGSAFFITPLMAVQEPVIELMMGHQLVHTIISSPRPWIEEGVGYLGQMLVRERQDGRDAALRLLNQFNAPLADVEKAALQAGKPQPLATSNDQLLYRAKSAFVWFMLRDLAGNDALSAAVRKYQPEADTQPAYIQAMIEAQMKPKGNLEAFFDDWVYRDKGLADFTIASVYPRATLGTNYVVTVTLGNLGDAGANAIVRVSSSKGERAEHTWVAGKSKSVIRVTYPDVPQEVLVNDGSVPEWNLENNKYEIKNLPNASTPK